MKKYFKIVNPKGHHGLVYKEGHNVDTLPFKPYGDCEEGGIYIAKEDIFAFLGHGTDVYECEPIGEIYENPASPKKYKVHELNMHYIGKWTDIKVIDYLIEQGADIHAQNDYALCLVAENRYFDIFNHIIAFGDMIHTNISLVLRLAATSGNLSFIKNMLYQGVDIHVDEECALRAAARCRQVEIVKYLIDNGADIHACNEDALYNAITALGGGDLEIINYLVAHGANMEVIFPKKG